ncbi:MAG: substrate-binding domain-containing protein, partial [Burkholderia vietnamiensis]|nr:substrate-binding domain-containing protein [Burkholderia vietnamiensis]
MKTKLMAAAAAAILAMPLAHAEKIGVTMASFDDTFLTILRNSISDAAKKDGATVQIEDGGNDVGKQLSQVQNMIAQKVDAIIVNAVDTDATPKITKMVTAAKIPLVYVNRKPVDFDKLPAGVAVVASDEKQSGTLQARQVCKLLGGKGDILVLMGELSNESARARTKDIEDVIATKECAGMKIVDKREGKWSRTQGQDITMNWLSSGAKFDAIVSNNDEMAIGAINALKAARKLTPKTVVAGIDATPDGLAAMKSGDLKV